MTFVYDDASNLIETEDAKGQIITYTYDGANRPLTEDYQDQGLPFSHNFNFDPSRPISPANRPDVAFFYDEPVPSLDLGDGTSGTAANTRGELAYVWDLSGEEHTSYDARGRVAYSVKRVADPVHGQLVSFTTRFSYDSADRVTALTYPDNDAVGYQYNDRGLLAGITGGPSGGILSNLGYWPSGQERQINYGNGVKTTYAHDARQRLNALVTAPQSAPGSPLISFAYSFDGASNLKNIADLRPGSLLPAGNPRRNTQSFQYDDLYRITGAQYSFAVPGAPAGNNGQINYRYDRIGNMLSQTSTIADTDPLTGLPLSNLGQMESGGLAGRSNRAGRQPGDPPGPHALTQIIPPAALTNASPRVYPYDDNGNLTNVDGLAATWDFKDRLVALEDAAMRADYVYDFADRRVTRRVTAKAGATNLQSFTTTYVGSHFEVREFDAPTKYVFNGDVRVARVTGTLSANTRVQRFRVATGWNLLSLAVTAANGGAQLAAGGNTLAQYQWNPTTADWVVVNPAQTLPAGAVLWVNAATNATLRATGVYPGPQPNTRAPPGGAFLPGYGLEVLPLTNQPAAVDLDVFQADTQAWQEQLPPPFGDLSGFPAVLAPGAACFAQAPAPTDLTLPDSSLSLRYYHEDHLGSSSCLSDANGNLVEEEAFYPFGAPRNQFAPRGVVEAYQFTQKERDIESGLDYFEARYLAANLGRFLTVDPLQHNDSPQELNSYSYVANQPLAFTDPSGLAGLGKGKAPAKTGVIAKAKNGVKKAKAKNGGPKPKVLATTPPAMLKTALNEQGKPKQTIELDERTVEISFERFPESAAHILFASGGNKNITLTLDRAGAAENRKKSLRGLRLGSKLAEDENDSRYEGLDRDEWPPAQFEEGGAWASVVLIDKHDNRGSGKYIKDQLSFTENGVGYKVKNGGKVTFKLVDIPTDLEGKVGEQILAKYGRSPHPDLAKRNLTNP